MNLKTLTQLTAILGTTYALKSFYASVTVNDLRWILAPTTLLVELISGVRFTFESHAGYMSDDHTFLIAASCAGVNFLIISFLVLTLGKLWRERTLAWRFVPFALFAAYIATLIANSVRIIIALQLRQFEFGFSFAEVHRVEGIIVYFGFLILLLYVSEKCAAGKQLERWNANMIFLSGSKYLLVVYYAVTLGIPFVRGGYREPDFWQHAMLVFLIPLVLILPIAIFTVVKNRPSSECNRETS